MLEFTFEGEQMVLLHCDRDLKILKVKGGVPHLVGEAPFKNREYPTYLGNGVFLFNINDHTKAYYGNKLSILNLRREGEKYILTEGLTSNFSSNGQLMSHIAGPKKVLVIKGMLLYSKILVVNSETLEIE